MMRRREFITLLSASAAGWPLTARAQQSAVPVVGCLVSGSPETSAGNLIAFREGLAETGYVEGRSVTIEYRFAQGQLDRLPMLAAELVRRDVAVVAAIAGSDAAQAAKNATTTIPPTKVRKRLHKRGNLGLLIGITLFSSHQHADAPHVIRLLRARRERPRCRYAAEQRDERAPLHSITPSAMASSDGGTVRPSICALWVLMTSSNLVDCTTGRSVGFSPLRMRPA